MQHLRLQLATDKPATVLRVPLPSMHRAGDQHPKEGEKLKVKGKDFPQNTGTQMLPK